MRHRELKFISILAILAVCGLPVRGQDDPRPLRMMARDILDLTPDQEAKLEEMARAHRAAREDSFDRMEKLSGELGELVKTPGYDLRKAEGLIDEMARLRAEQQKAGLRHRLEMRKVLTPDQIKKMDEYWGSFRRGRLAGFASPFGRGAGRFGAPWGRGFRMKPCRWRW